VGSQLSDRTDDVRRLLAVHLPDHAARSIVPLGSGFDNEAYEVDGEIVVRFRKPDDSGDDDPSVSAEARLLETVSAIVPVPVPIPLFVSPDDDCIAYAKLGGVPLLDVPEPRRSDYGLSIAPALGELLAAMHTAPADRMAGLVDMDDDSLGEWRREAASYYEKVGDRLPAPRRRSAEAFLAAPPPRDATVRVFSHNDLGIEHILVDPGSGALTGVIDWTDATIVDPAADLGRLVRDLRHSGFDLVLRNYRAGVDDPDALRDRAWFYARCMVLEDLAYGEETGRAVYSDKALAAAEWLFAG
jgi:aminoglycoside phosphotransferase (APT) family kinase protein